MKSSTFELGLTKLKNSRATFSLFAMFQYKAFYPRGQQLRKLEKKKRFYARKKFNSYRKGMAHQHGGRDVMRKQSNCPTIQFLIVVSEAAPKTLKNVWKKWWMPSFPGNFSTC